MDHMGKCVEQFEYFTSIVGNIVENYLPLKCTKTDSSNKPWITPQIKYLISKLKAKQLEIRETQLCFVTTGTKSTLCLRTFAPGFTKKMLRTSVNQIRENAGQP